MLNLVHDMKTNKEAEMPNSPKDVSDFTRFETQSVATLVMHEVITNLSFAYHLFFIDSMSSTFIIWISLLSANLIISGLLIFKFSSSSDFKCFVFVARVALFIAFNLLSALSIPGYFLFTEGVITDYSQSIRVIYSTLFSQGLIYSLIDKFKVLIVIVHVATTITASILIQAFITKIRFYYLMPEYFIIVAFIVYSFIVYKKHYEHSTKLDYSFTLLDNLPFSLMVICGTDIVFKNKYVCHAESTARKEADTAAISPCPNDSTERNSKQLINLSDREYSQLGIANNESNTLNKLKSLINIETGKSLYKVVSTLINSLDDLTQFENLGIYSEQTNEGRFGYQAYARMAFSPWKTTPSIELVTYKTNIQEKSTEIEENREKLASVAHEFKTPLICTSLLAENLREHILNSKLNEALKTAEDLQKVSDYVFYLIDDIMQSTKNTNDRKSTIAVNIEEKPPEEDLLFVFEILQVLLRVKNGKNNVITPLLNVSEDVLRCKIMTDSVRLRQILLNFISNSVKFTKIGNICLSSSIVNNSLIIDIIDSGIGMPSEMVKKIQKGQKVIDVTLNKEMNKYGTGTGLSVVRTIVELLNYKYELFSIQNKGTTVRLTIPTISLNNKIENEEEMMKLKKLGENTERASLAGGKLLTISSHDSVADVESVCNSSCEYRRSELSQTVIFDQLNQINNSYLQPAEPEKLNKDDTKRKRGMTLRQTNTGGILTIQTNELSRNSKLFMLRFSVLSSKQRHKSWIPELLNGYHHQAVKVMKTLPQIIICDDCELIRNSLIKMLRSITIVNKQYELITCYDGAEVLLKLVQDQTKGNLIKLIMIDENMDYLSGTQTVSIINRLAQENKLKKVCCVSISANDASNNANSVYDSIIMKPVTKQKLNEFFNNFSVELIL